MYLHKQSFSSGQCDGPGRAAGAPHAQSLASPTVLGANSIAAAEPQPRPQPIVSDRRTHHDVIGLETKKLEKNDDGWRAHTRGTCGFGEKGEQLIRLITCF